MSHLTIAASEDAFKALFAALRDAFTFSHSDDGDFGPFSASYDVAFHLEGGEVDLRSDGTVRIKELDIKWDTLDFCLGLDIPELCVGGWCINMPWPIPDICLPEVCIFSDDPDIEVCLDLSGYLTSEVSAIASLRTNYRIDPGRLAGMSDVQAENAGVPNKWQVFVDPESVDIDIFDFADIVGDLLENALTSAVEALIPGGWVRDLILDIIGGVVDLIRDILDLPDDIGEWLEDLLGTSLGLLNIIVTAVADYLAGENAIVEFEDPFPVLTTPSSLIPVKIPIRDLTVTVTDVEMILEANVGA